jgi:hypothetical protein
VDEQRLILVVEDDEATRAFLAENLAADGFRTATATSAGEGLRAIEARQPTLDTARDGVGAVSPRVARRCPRCPLRTSRCLIPHAFGHRGSSFRMRAAI